MTRPWFPWYPADYAKDTQHLSFIEDSAYRRMLDYYYQFSKLPAKDDVLLRVCRPLCDEERTAVVKIAREFFVEVDGYLVHARADAEIAKSAYITRVRSDASRKRRGKNTTNDITNDITKHPSKGVHNSQLTIENQKKTISSSDSPSDPKGIIFDLGVSILTKAGSSQIQARTFLGKYAKADASKLAQLVGHLSMNPKVNPRAYIAAAFKPEERGLVI